jgi:hypothetical protein
MNVVIGDGKRVRNIVIGVLVATFLFCAALGGFLWWFLGNEEDSVHKSSDQLAAALAHNDPSRAPGEAEEYVSGVRGYFGPVKAAKVVDARKVDNYAQTSSSNDDRSWWVSTIFMRTERGAALLLVSYDDGGLDPHTARITSVRELSPRRVAKDALTTTELADAKAGFASRGGKAADQLALDGSRTRIEEVRSRLGGQRRPRRPSKRVQKVPRRLKCVQRAHGDIAKLQRCSKL